MGSYEPVRSVRRAIDILTALNADGSMSLSEIAAAVSLTKPTTLRLLETLAAENMVERDDLSRDYKVSFGVQRLSWGFREGEQLTSAIRELDAITRDHLWPCALGVPTRHTICTRYSTHRASPLNWWNPEIRTHLPMLRYALGLAYLAFCTPEGRDAHFDLIEDADERAGRPPIDRSTEIGRLDAVRAAGYAFRPHSNENRTCSIAVPLLSETRPIGSLVMTYFSRTMSRNEAERRFLPLLQRSAAAATKHQGSSETAP